MDNFVLETIAEFFGKFDHEDNWVDALDNYLASRQIDVCDATNDEKNDQDFIVAYFDKDENRKAVYATCQQFDVSDSRRYTID